MITLCLSSRSYTGARLTGASPRHLEACPSKIFGCRSFVSPPILPGTTQVHAKGNLALALRASIAIPGLLPPVVANEGVLADGAMMNNLPVDVMADLDRGPVIGVDVARDLALTSAPRPSILRRLLNIPADAPSIATLLLRAATVSSDANVEITRSQARFVLQPPLASIGLRSWRSFDEAVEIGYRHAMEVLNQRDRNDV